MVLLNSTTWSCSLTRKGNLTYFEAVQSETVTERDLCDFPPYLELPILFIVYKFTNRGRFEELVNDIYHIMKDRYFINEEVTFSERSRKYTARIVSMHSVMHQNRGAVEGSSEVKEPVMPLADEYVYNIEIVDNLMSLEDKQRQGVSYTKLL